jgi:peptide/nickel transport system substrate-binding protein
VFALGTNPKNLDPRFAQDAFSDKIARLIFSPLLERMADGSVRGHLAERFEQPDETTYVIHLRRDARFHDGSPVTAGDVAGTYRSILDPSLKTVKRLFLKPIESIETPDKWTVIFHLSEPNAPFPQVLSGIGIAPVALLTEHGRDFNQHLIGSGPFRFESQVVDESIVLKRNADWFGGEVGIETLRFKIVPDATVRVLEVMHGSADITQNDIPLHVIERLANEEDLKVTTSESSLVKYLAFNMDRPILADVRVRRAIVLAIDREPIVRYKLRGYATLAKSFLHPDSWAFEPASRSWEHNPDRARALLDEAGYPEPEGGGPRLSLVYKTSMNSTAIAVAKILKRQLARVGIAMDLRTNEWGVFFNDIIHGDFDMYTLSGLGIVDPDWYTYVVHSDSFPPNGANRPRYHNPRIDELLNLGKVTVDPEGRAAIYREVQMILSEDIPLVPLWYEHNVVVSGRNIEGYESTPHGDFSSLPKVRKVGRR